MHLQHEAPQRLLQMQMQMKIKKIKKKLSQDTLSNQLAIKSLTLELA